MCDTRTGQKVGQLDGSYTIIIIIFFFYFADFQFTVFDTEDNLQEAASKLTQIIK